MKKKGMLLALAAAFCIGNMTVYAESVSEAEAQEPAEEQVFDYEHDYQYMYSDWITRGEDGYYIRITDILYYASEDLSVVIPLCHKPECLHAMSETLAERIECGAFMGSHGSGEDFLQYYDGTLYSSTGFDLENMRPYHDEAGMGYNVVYALSPDGIEKTELELPDLNDRIYLHRGYIYYKYSVKEELGAGKVKQMQILERKNIESGETEIIMSSDSIDYYTTITLYKDYLYFNTYQNNKEVYWIYNVNTGELKEHVLPESEGLLVYDYVFDGDHLLMKGYNYWEDIKGKDQIWMSNLDGSEREKAFVLTEYLDKLGSKDCGFKSDGEFLYFSHSEDNLIQYYDRETMEYVGEIILEEGSISGFGDENYLFLTSRDYDKDTVQIKYISKAEMREGTAEPKFLLEVSMYDNGWVWYE